MLSAIFQPEINSLESHIAQLQAQIAAYEQRISHLNEAEFVSAGAIEALQSAVQKISSLAPDALHNLRLAVLNLFKGDENPNDDAGNQPINPAPQPDLSGQTCKIDPDAYWQSAQPNGSAWDITTPIACQMEDAPSESLQGQVLELACLIGHPELCEGELLNPPQDMRYEGSDDRGLPARLISVKNPVHDEQQYIELVQVNLQVAYQRKHDGEIACAYAGFNNKVKAKQWGEWLAVQHSVANGFEVRTSKRLTDYKHELKLWGMSLKQIERLASCDLSKTPPSNYGDAPKRKPEPAPPAHPVIEVGDIVASNTVPTWHYVVLAVLGDGKLSCRRLNIKPDLVIPQSEWAVSLVSKAAKNEAANTEVEAGMAIESRSAESEISPEEALASIQPPLSPAYNPYPIGRRGAQANWEVYQAAKQLERQQNQLTASGDDEPEF